MQESFRNKVIVITGAVGTVGSEVLNVLASEYQPAEIRLYDNNESEIFHIDQEYQDSGIVTSYLGDVRDREKLELVFQGADIVFHLAALKHVHLAEYNSFDAVQTNIYGVQNVIQAAFHNNVKRVLFASSDKAVNPTSVMGTTKLMGERLITAANITSYSGNTILSSTRFGNVLGSRGSVVPIFARQIREGGPVTITDDAMTRFVMSVRQSADLAFLAARTDVARLQILVVYADLVGALVGRGGIAPMALGLGGRIVLSPCTAPQSRCGLVVPGGRFAALAVGFVG